MNNQQDLILNGFPTYAGRVPLTEGDKSKLTKLNNWLSNTSSNQELRRVASLRNKQVVDPIQNGALIHGVRAANIDKLESILDKGILCAEFLGQFEDGETYFHADFVASDKNSLYDWQKTINNAGTNILKDKSWHAGFKWHGFAPAYQRKPQAIALIVNPSIAKSWDSKNESTQGDIKNKFINVICSDKQVSILGGVPSTDIVGMIIPDNFPVKELQKTMEEKGMYIPVFDTQAEKLF
jgi:hypothetical protein